jgi:hypothetical protein
MAAMYCYESLETASAIHLLRIHAGSRADLLEGTIAPFSLSDHNLLFHALSYTWGKPAR